MFAVHVKRFARFLRKRHNLPDFSDVEDARHRRGRRWSLTGLLNAVLVGVMAMETSPRGVERLTRDLEGCRRYFGVERRVPDSTLTRVLAGHCGEYIPFVKRLRRTYGGRNSGWSWWRTTPG